MNKKKEQKAKGDGLAISKSSIVFSIHHIFLNICNKCHLLSNIMVFEEELIWHHIFRRCGS